MKMRGPTTCPGIAGYCSEAYVGDTCLVVCSRGRNNVPQCQQDGTWTDIPRCIEHEPGVQEQTTGICPGIPGYCSLDWPGALCEFQCPVGPSIRSSCTPDGTWEPYPTCQGDPRETQDGCNPCPGPVQGPRDRTAVQGRKEGNRGSNIRSKSSVPTRLSSSISRNVGGKQQGGGRRGGGGGLKSKESQKRNRYGSRNNRKGQRGRDNQSKRGQFQSKDQSSRAKKPSHTKLKSRERNLHPNTASSDKCQGNDLQVCVDECPGFSIKVFRSCVSGCANRCNVRG